MKLSICKNQFLGICSNCTYDVDPNHRPNNLDCPGYRPIGFVIMELEHVKEVEKVEEDCEILP